MVNVFIISAPSGSGKSTLVSRIRSSVPNLEFSISYTTRKPRGAEQDGREPGGAAPPFGDFMAQEDQRSIDNYFNKSNVVAPTDPSVPFGNAGRNIARGYPFYQADLGLHKAFPLWSEDRKIEFRGEFFNLLNHTNFGIPNSTRSSSAFGTIRSTFPARQIQFALKLVF